MSASLELEVFGCGDGSNLMAVKVTIVRSRSGVADIGYHNFVILHRIDVQ